MNAVEWFKHRSYDYKQFSDLEALGSSKRDLGLTVGHVETVETQESLS